MNRASFETTEKKKVFISFASCGPNVYSNQMGKGQKRVFYTMSMG